MAFVEKSGKKSWRVRYWKDDGTHGSIPGYTTKKAAQAKADDIDTDQRRGTFLDPDAGKLTLTEWTVTWFDSIDVADATTSPSLTSVAAKGAGGPSVSYVATAQRRGNFADGKRDLQRGNWPQ